MMTCMFVFCWRGSTGQKCYSLTVRLSKSPFLCISQNLTLQCALTKMRLKLIQIWSNKMNDNSDDKNLTKTSMHFSQQTKTKSKSAAKINTGPSAYDLYLPL